MAGDPESKIVREIVFRFGAGGPGTNEVSLANVGPAEVALAAKYLELYLNMTLGPLVAQGLEQRARRGPALVVPSTAVRRKPDA